MSDKDWLAIWKREYEAPRPRRWRDSAMDVMFVVLWIIILSIIIEVFTPALASGATCHTCNVKQQVHHVQAVQAVAVYPQQYGVVAPWLQEQAALRYAVRQELAAALRQELPAALRQELAQLQQAQPLQSQQQCETCNPPMQAQPEQQQPHGAMALRQDSVMAVSCVKCHSGDKPKAKLSLDVNLDDATRSKIARKILANEMPVDGDGTPHPLNDVAKTRLLLELFGEPPSQQDAPPLPPQPEQ